MNVLISIMDALIIYNKSMQCLGLVKLFHNLCGSTTSLDDHCLVAGISFWLQNVSPEVLRLAEAPRNHFDLAKMEEKEGYIAL